MTTLTWVGGGDNRANNPADWDQNRAPLPGDMLLMPNSSSINIQNNDLQGNPLQLGTGGPPQSISVNLTLSHHAQAKLAQSSSIVDVRTTINVAGNDSLTFSTSSSPGNSPRGSVSVNLAPHAHLRATFDLHQLISPFPFGPPSVLVLGPSGPDGPIPHSGANLVNDEHSNIIGATVVITPDVLGSGSFLVRPDFLTGHSSAAGSLEFRGSVAGSQSVTVSGATSSGTAAPGLLKIDDPTGFHATVTMETYAELDLVGLAQADSYTFKNDMLSLYTEDRVIGKLRLTNNGPDLVVSRSASDVYVTQTGEILPPAGSTLLPSHQSQLRCGLDSADASHVLASNLP